MSNIYNTQRNATTVTLGWMEPNEVRRSAERGTQIAIKLRDKNAEQRFRFPHATFILAMRKGYATAAETATKLAIGNHSKDDAMKYVKRTFAVAKQEIKDRDI